MTTDRQDSTGTAHALGIDVGGTGIKGGLVDLATGAVLGDRLYLETPVPSTPDAVAEAITTMVGHFGWDGPVGVALPGVIHEGAMRTAANVHESWIDCEVGPLFDRHLPDHTVSVLNDADGAAVTESVFGAAKGVSGLVVLLTFGTGIGSAFLVDGRLLPNTEFGHMLVRGLDGTVDEAEHQASGSLRQSRGWSFEEWTPHVSNALRSFEDLLWPSLFVLGGGVSEASDEWFPLLDNRTPVVAATRLNDAGLIGAAAVAAGEDGSVDLSTVLQGIVGGPATSRRA